jgi:hypothetical protein
VAISKLLENEPIIYYYVALVIKKIIFLLVRRVQYVRNSHTYIRIQNMVPFVSSAMTHQKKYVLCVIGISLLKDIIKMAQFVILVIIYIDIEMMKVFEPFLN